MLYMESPDIVQITTTDTVKTIERYVVGKSLVEIVEILEAVFSKDKIQEKKPRRKRRTKAEMETQATPTKLPEFIPETLESPAPKQKRGRKAKSLWPENEKEPVIAA